MFTVTVILGSITIAIGILMLIFMWIGYYRAQHYNKGDICCWISIALFFIWIVLGITVSILSAYR